MEKYEILLIILTISCCSVRFKIIIIDLTIFKIINIKHMFIIFISNNNNWFFNILPYKEYQLPIITVN